MAPDDSLEPASTFSLDLLAALSARPASPLRPGQRIADRYEIVGALGSGGMGDVYEARHLATGGRVALKVLSRVDGSAAARFEAEARHAAALNHPHTVTVIDHGTDGDRPFLVMAFVTGASLAARLQADGPLPWSFVGPVVAQVLDALCVAHEHAPPIVHRDVKPSNIVVSRRLGSPHATLVDFGISTTGTGPASLAGTPGYMAPELWLGDDGGPRADLYALGCTVYELLTGVLPFDGPDPTALASAHVGQPVPPLEVAGLPRHVAGWVARLLAKDPADRPASARAAWEGLEAGPLSPPRGPRHTDRFVGRAAEVAAIRDAVQGSRLVTVHGPGGAGKTRLAEESAPDALFVDLTEARSAGDVSAAVARCLHIEPRGDPAAEVGVALRGAGVGVLLLDNFEQVTAHAGATLGRWLALAPSTRFLVTSREPLGLPGETSVRLGPLAVDDGVALFVARAAREDLDPDEVAPLVEALDGLPLAIELAAARTRVLSVAAIREHLAHRFEVLRTPRGRGSTGRQATMWGTIAWSWDLLEPWEQACLAQCSVFHGGFSAEDAAAIVELGRWPEAPWLVDVLHALTERSCLRSPDAEGRLGMFLSIRDFARAKLGDAERAIADRHARRFAALDLPPVLVPGVGRSVIVRIQRDAENIRAAMAHARARMGDDPGWTEPCARLAIMAGAADPYRGKVEPAIEALDAAIEPDTDLPVDLQLEVRLARAYFRASAGFDLAVQEEQTLAVARDAARLGLARYEIRALRTVAVMRTYRADAAGALAFTEQAMALWTDDPLMRCLLVRSRGHARVMAHDQTGLADLEEALELAADLKEPVLQLYLLTEIAAHELDTGEVERPLQRLQASLAQIRAGVAPTYLLAVAMQLSRAWLQQGRLSEAREMADLAVARGRMMGGTLLVNALTASARVRVAEGRRVRAEAEAREALDLADRLGMRSAEAELRSILATVTSPGAVPGVDP